MPLSIEDLKLLIAHGEDDKTEFKETLHLGANATKAEFIKDMMALVNAHGDRTGYLLIGVDNTDAHSLHDIAAHNFDDANFQQLVNSYLEPPVRFTFRLYDVDGTTIGVIEVPPSDERFHIVKKELKDDKNNFILRQGERLIRSGSSKKPVSAWDDRELRKQHQRQQSPQPLLAVCFENETDEVTVKAHWSKDAGVTGRNMGVVGYKPQSSLYQQPLPSGTVHLAIRIDNRGTFEAQNIKVYIDVPEGCRVPERTDFSVFSLRSLPGQWRVYEDTEVNRIIISGPHLTHGLARIENDIAITFPFVHTDYELQWSAHAGNMLNPTNGVLKVHVTM